MQHDSMTGKEMEAVEARGGVDGNQTMKKLEIDVDAEGATSLSAGDTSNDQPLSGREKDFLSLITCPITKQILQDPVVLADGTSYERSAVQDRNEAMIYPNRALKSIMADINISTSTIISKPTLFQQAKRFVTAQVDRPLPDAFYCPITLSLMHKPVIDPQGCTYEKVAIIKWIEVNGDSPVTREPLTVDQLISNHALEGLLLLEANRDDVEDIHPAILKWKKESAVMVENMSVLTLAAANVNASATTTANNNSDTSTRRAQVVAPFPTTPEDFQTQLQEARRLRSQKRWCRLSVILLLILVIVVGFFVPLLAAIASVIMILFIWYAMSSSVGSEAL
jgi:hypothetical protein